MKFFVSGKLLDEKELVFSLREMADNSGVTLLVSPNGGSSVYHILEITEKGISLCKFVSIGLGLPTDNAGRVVIQGED